VRESQVQVEERMAFAAAKQREKLVEASCAAMIRGVDNPSVAEYRALSPAAQAAILREAALWPDPSIAQPEPRSWLERSKGSTYREISRGRVHHFHPDGRHLRDFLPDEADADELVTATEGWVSLDLAGVRWAPGRPTLYGQCDEGAAPPLGAEDVRRVIEAITEDLNRSVDERACAGHITGLGGPTIKDAKGWPLPMTDGDAEKLSAAVGRQFLCAHERLYLRGGGFKYSPGRLFPAWMLPYLETHLERTGRPALAEPRHPAAPVREPPAETRRYGNTVVRRVS